MSKRFLSAMQRGQRYGCIMGLVVLVAIPLRAAKGPLLIAHRGDPDHFPENTLPGIKAGAAVADSIKLDARETRDCRLVVIHDATMNRTTTANGFVANLTVDQVRRADAGIKTGPTFRGLTVPTLEEAVAAVPKEKPLIIERKAGKAETFIEFLRPASKEREIYLESGDWEFLDVMKHALPELKLIFWEPRVFGEETVQRAAAQGISIVLYRANALPAGAMAKIHHAGLKVWVYTVDDVAEARRLTLRGVDGIMTNRPQLFIAVRDVLSAK